MEHIDVDSAPKRAKLAGGGNEDRLSALPDDVLLDVLLKTRNAADAARTSILSSRWRLLWAFLPELHFSDGIDPRRIRPALAAHEAPDLRCLVAIVRGASPKSMAAWLPVAVRRLSGDLVFHNTTSCGEWGRGAFQLPCFENATALSLDLGFLVLAMPASGVFVRLTDLSLVYVQLNRVNRLGDAISSPRCPALRKLTVSHARGLPTFIIHSESLLQLKLSNLHTLKKLTVVAPALEELTLSSCLASVMDPSQLVVNISAPELLVLKWKDTYDPSFFELGEMAHLQCLDIGTLVVYGSGKFVYSPDSRILLQCCEAIHKLNLKVVHLSRMVYNQHLSEDMTRLPEVTFLNLVVTALSHSFGACLFNILRMCTSVIKLAIDMSCNYEEECPSDCFCDHPPNWKFKDLILDRLQEVDIINSGGTGHEVAFLERLFSWATALEQITVTFDETITESMAMKEFRQKLLSFSRPEICMRFFVYRGSEKVLYVPEG
ncbi:hypothetical protein VPH35_001421 [Triticum aestivum]|uniref:F-box/LRR-repeat protein 15/At3g58940/PEG3-like LRR domain-containing protein n=2 Tax=Triticum TaxID=4564 RepID=A0A3B5XWL0_WHEAT|nr:putative F-box/FBD/LRR-repeat protein At1g22000 [Triticum aestivum]